MNPSVEVAISLAASRLTGVLTFPFWFRTTHQPVKSADLPHR